MTVWYFPLESVRSRYTQQLCEEWMPPVLRAAGALRVVDGQPIDAADDIVVGRVLDATGRGHYALTQSAAFLVALRRGEVRSGDVLYFQDFWTPGVDAVFYALHLHGVQVRAYAMIHAQSVDEYDFTHEMLPWVRPFELGVDACLSGAFVASTVHKDQLRRAGFRVPLHVIGLPFPTLQVRGQFGHLTRLPKRRAVVYSSRFDREKNPAFMAAVAEAFLASRPDWEWWATTSAHAVRSNDPDVPALLAGLAERQPRFRLFVGLSKEGYYRKLAEAAVQFNCSWQDYVSWTLCEASAFGCDLCYPDYRSFPECVPSDRRYRAFDVGDALRVLGRAIDAPRDHLASVVLAERWRAVVRDVLSGQYRGEADVWGTR